MPRLNLPLLKRRKVSLDKPLTEIIDAENLDHIVRTIRDWGRHMDVGVDTNTATIAAILARDNAVCQVERFAVQPIAHSTLVPVQFDSVLLDPSEWFDSATPTRITPSKPGWVDVSTNAMLVASVDYSLFELAIYRNGVHWWTDSGWPSNSATFGPKKAWTSPEIEMNGPTDYLELVVRHQNAAAVSKNLVYATFEVEWKRPLFS